MESWDSRKQISPARVLRAHTNDSDGRILYRQIGSGVGLIYGQNGNLRRSRYKTGNTTEHPDNGQEIKRSFC